MKQVKRKIKLMQTMHIRALAMILLIITLPIYAAMVFADSNPNGVGILNATVTGSRGIPGFVGAAGPMSYDVVADYGSSRQASNNAITLDDIHMQFGGDEGTMSFCADAGSCSPVSGSGGSGAGTSSTYRCTCTNSWVPESPWQFTFRLYNGQSRVGDYRTVQLYPDTIPPAFNSFTTTLVNDSLRVDYSAQDKACTDAECNGKCSGISNIQFYVDNAPAFTQAVNQAPNSPNSCSYQGSWTYRLPEGRHTVYALATDNIGNGNRTNDTRFSVDITAPRIPNAFTIENNGRPLSYISTSGPYSRIQNAVVVVMINELNNIADVRADLSSLNKNYQASGFDYTNVAGVVVNQAVNPKRVIFSVPVIDMDSGTAQINVTAHDDHGNTGTGAPSISLTVDNSGPAIISLTTNYCSQDSSGANVCYVKAHDNRLSLRLNEQGAGMSNDYAFLNMQSFGNNYQNPQRMYECSHLNSGPWECYGYADLQETNGDKNGVTLYVSVIDPTMDDIGNQATGERRFEFKADTKSPSFETRDISVRDASDLLASVLRSNQPIHIEANITEDVSGINAANVIADFSDISSGSANASADDCILADATTHRYVCTWDKTMPLEPGYGKVVISATDNAGNTHSAISSQVFVAGLRDGEANFWDAEAQIDAGPALNKNFLIMSQGTYQAVKITLKPRQNTGARFVHGINLQGSSCVLGEANKIVSTMPQPALMFHDSSNGQGKTSVTAIFNIPGYPQEAEFKTALSQNYIRQLNITCSLEVVQGVQQYGTIYGTNEKVNATIKIQLLPGVFDPGKVQYNKITSTQKEIESLTKVTDALKGVLKFLGNICPQANAARQIVASATVIECTLSYPIGGGLCRTMQEANARFATVWYGKGSFEGANKDFQKIAQPNTVGTKSPFWIGLSPYKPVSLGFMCQMYLCNDCVSWFDDTVNANKGADWLGGGFAGLTSQPNNPQSASALPNTADAKNINYFERNGNNQIGIGDIQNNIVLSVMCVPPCLTGIYSTLDKWRSILVTYNECQKRVNFFKGATTLINGNQISSTTCEEFKSSMQCQLLWGQLWNAFMGKFIQAAVHTFIYKIVDKTVFKLMDRCNANGSAGAANNFACAVGIIVDATGLYLEVIKARDAINTLFGKINNGKSDAQKKQDVNQQFTDQGFGDPYNG